VPDTKDVPILILLACAETPTIIDININAHFDNRLMGGPSFRRPAINSVPPSIAQFHWECFTAAKLESPASGNGWLSVPMN
jgi:hypothetical protein